MLTNPQAMTFQKKNINVYHQHKTDKTDREIFLYHLRGRCAMNTLPVYYSFFFFFNLQFVFRWNIYKEQGQFEESGGGGSSKGRRFE